MGEKQFQIFINEEEVCQIGIFILWSVSVASWVIFFTNHQPGHEISFSSVFFICVINTWLKNIFSETIYNVNNDENNTKKYCGIHISIENNFKVTPCCFSKHKWIIKGIFLN